MRFFIPSISVRRMYKVLACSAGGRTCLYCIFGFCFQMTITLLPSVPLDCMQLNWIHYKVSYHHSHACEKWYNKNSDPLCNMSD
jgi:hypothetical protein